MIDAAIPLSIKTPEAQDPLASFGRVAQIQSMLQQQKLQGAQLQGAQIQNQEAQMNLEDQQKMRQVFASWDGQNPDDLLKGARQAGVQPKTIMGLQTNLMDLKTKAATLDKDTRANAITKNTQIQSALAPVLNEQDPQKQAAAWDQASKGLVESGIISPEAAAQHPYPGSPEAAKVYISGLNLEKWTLSQQQQATAQQRSAGAAVSAAELPGKQAQAQQQVSSTLAQQAANVYSQQGPAGYAKWKASLAPEQQSILPEVNSQARPADVLAQLRQIGMTAEQQSQAQIESGRATESARHNSIEEKQGAARLGIERQNAAVGAGRLDVEKQRFGFEQGGGISTQAKAIDAGDLDPQTVRVMVRSNPGLIEQAKAVDPGFDMANLDRRYDTLKEFNSTSNTKAGGQAVALNTLIHHAELYKQAADALKNGSFRPGNAAYNAVASAFGAAPPTNAALVARFFASETGKVASGGVPAEGEINGILKNLGTSNSPDQMKQAGDTLLGIAAGRLQPLQERVKDAKLDKVVNVLGQSSKDILQRNGYDPNTMEKAKASGTSAGFAVSAPNGKTYHFKSQADLDNFKKEAGIQ